MIESFIYHEKVKCPLFHASYEIVVGENMPDMLEHMSVMCSGIRLMDEGSMNVPGYTCLVKGSNIGSHFYVLLCIDGDEEWPSIDKTIVHEATHLSWFLLDSLQIDINVDNHEVQCYLMESIVTEISRVVVEAKGKLSLETL